MLHSLGGTLESFSAPGCPVNGLQRRRHQPPFLVGDEVERIPDPAHNAGLGLGLGEDRRDRLGKALRSVRFRGPGLPCGRPAGRPERHRWPCSEPCLRPGSSPVGHQRCRSAIQRPRPAPIRHRADQVRRDVQTMERPQLALDLAHRHAAHTSPRSSRRSRASGHARSPVRSSHRPSAPTSGHSRSGSYLPAPRSRRWWWSISAFNALSASALFSASNRPGSLDADAASRPVSRPSRM